MYAYNDVILLHSPEHRSKWALLRSSASTYDSYLRLTNCGTVLEGG